VPVVDNIPLGDATLVRAWRLDVLSGATWLPVRGISNGQPPTTQIANDTIRTLNGKWDMALKTGRAWSATLTLTRKKTRGSVPVYDAGQEKIRAALSDDWGSVHIRAYKMDGIYAEAFEGDALVDWQYQAGDAGSLDVVQVVLLGQGALTPITHPATV
jgi:hypothetical protein